MRQVLWDFLRGSVLVLFFVSTLLISAESVRVFVSPDENAAFFFAQTFAHTGSLSVAEPLNNVLQNLLHPRSIVAIGGEFVPGSFLGLPIMAGILLWGYGDAAALLFTPFLALFAVLAWRSTIRSIFDDELLADLSAFFLMVHPAFLYYSGRVMMNNVAFVAFLIFAAWFFIARPLKRIETRFASELRQLECLLGGLMVGAALFVRTAELVWVVIGFFALLFIYRAALGWRNVVSSILGLLLMCAVIGGTNAWVYGSPFSTGYTVHAEIGEVTTSTVNSVVPTLPSQVGTFFFPFGIHERSVLRHAWQYGIYLYPWMTLLSFLGFCLVCFRVPPSPLERVGVRNQFEWRLLIGIFILLTLWLGVVYGSWNFFDNPDPTLITIGNSYVRYWLPVFVLSSVFSAYIVTQTYQYCILRSAGRRVRLFLTNVLLALILFVPLLLSVNLVFFGADGIVPTRAALDSFVGKRMGILARTEPNAIIIVDRADKYLFPYRQVIVPLRSDVTYQSLGKISTYAPLYYFGITLPEKDVAYLVKTYLAPQGLTIDLVATMNDESLYRLRPSISL